MFKGLKMTRFNASNERASAHGRGVSFPYGREARRAAKILALCAALGFLPRGDAKAVQYQSSLPYQTTARSQGAERQARQYQSAQNATKEQNASRSKTPILSGLFGQTPRQTQESQRAGLFGGRSILSSLRDGGAREETQRESREFHARSQHLETSRQGSYASNAAQNAAALSQASTNPAEANEALSKVPWDLFPEETRARLEKIASSPTLYRRLPMAGGRCNPELFDFFLSYPNAVVELWKQMGYDEIDMKPIGSSTYAISEKNGSNGRITILYQTSELAVVHVAGVYRGAGLLRPVEGEAFLVLQTRYTEDPTRTPLVVCRLDAFVAVNNLGADLVARAFNTMLGKIADSNFTQTLAFIDSVSQIAEQDPRQFQVVVSQLYGLSSEARATLQNKAVAVARQASQRESGQLANYRLLPKANEPSPGYARLLSRATAQPSPTDASYASNAARAATSPDAVYDSSVDYANASSASAGSATSSRGGTFGSVHELDVDVSDEFSLALDDGDYDLGIGDETIMTGEEFLAKTAAPSPESASAESLAKVGPRPSRNARALKILDEEENAAAPYADSAPPLVSTDDLTISVERLDSESDDESTVEILETPDVEADEDADAAPVAIPLSIALPSTRVPPAAKRFEAPTVAPKLDSREESEEVEENEEEVAEITIDENGVPILDFNVEDDEQEEEDDAAALANLPPLEESPDELDDEEARTEPEASEIDALELESHAETESDADETDSGWTRSALANPGTRRVAKKIVKNAADDEEDDASRQPLVTRRYSPAAKSSNVGQSVNSTKDEKNESEKQGSEDHSREGKRVATFRWSPVPGTFVVKTAAVDPKEDSPASKSATFAKPEFH